MKRENQLTVLLFLVALTEIISEYFRFLPLIYVFKPTISVVLMALYWVTSAKREVLFFLTISTSLLTNVLFIPNDIQFIFLGLIAFVIHRIINIYYIIKLTKIKDILPILLASVPFFLIFFYIFIDTDLLSKEVFYIMILHNILISLMGGFALANYVLNENNRSMWLTICVLFFVSLHFLIFIEKFYISLNIFRPIAMTLNTFAYYSFYKFVLANETNSQSSILVN
ncbi:lysoplasmalogenase family protein [Flavobacterium sp.]|uniref:lysoplasmalogenase family protein n=1 Tax=Flavobacterium sp. TaxID=239 RepID=UPI002616FCF6|nr:lysoplasmalogenase family protein [Flavobacterium sp.]MDD2986760.1 lysoplasmalogenase family protein [Flavobacterium sp.]